MAIKQETQIDRKDFPLLGPAIEPASMFFYFKCQISDDLCVNGEAFKTDNGVFWLNRNTDKLTNCNKCARALLAGK